MEDDKKRRGLGIRKVLHREMHVNGKQKGALVSRKGARIFYGGEKVDKERLELHYREESPRSLLKRDGDQDPVELRKLL